MYLCYKYVYRQSQLIWMGCRAQGYDLNRQGSNTGKKYNQK